MIRADGLPYVRLPAGLIMMPSLLIMGESTAKACTLSSTTRAPATKAKRAWSLARAER
jgi:hypothetical protein